MRRLYWVDFEDGEGRDDVVVLDGSRLDDEVQNYLRSRFDDDDAPHVKVREVYPVSAVDNDGREYGIVLVEEHPGCEDNPNPGATWTPAHLVGPLAVTVYRSPDGVPVVEIDTNETGGQPPRVYVDDAPVFGAPTTEKAS